MLVYLLMVLHMFYVFVFCLEAAVTRVAEEGIVLRQLSLVHKRLLLFLGNHIESYDSPTTTRTHSHTCAHTSPIGSMLRKCRERKTTVQ